MSSAHVEIRNNIKTTKDYSKNTPSIGSHQTWLYTSNLSFFERNINCWRRSWNRIHDMDVQDRMTKVGLNFGYLNEITYIAAPRPGENEIGIKALKQNREFWENTFKFK